MNRRVFQRCLPGLLVLLSTCLRSSACTSGSVNITALGGAGTNNTYVATGLNAAGQLTGYYNGALPPHAFSYQGGVVTDLGTLGGIISQGFAINGSGQVVGSSYTGGNLQLNGFLYTGGNLLNLGTLGGSYSSANLINDAGQVAGVSMLPNATDTTAFFYSQGVMTSLGTLGGPYSAAFSMNNLGQVVGESPLLNGDVHAFISGPSSLIDLGTLGGNYSSAFWINDAGTVVGESALSNSDVHAFLYSGGTMADLGTFGGTYSSAFEINSNGQVIGVATTTSNAQTKAFIYTAGVLTDLGTLGGISATPYALNNRGQVVGAIADAVGGSRAFLWETNQMVDLNSLLPADSGWQLSVAEFINDSGRIVGTGTSNGVAATFILDLATANNPPIAVAGPDQTVDCQAQVTLNGSGSTDPDNDPLVFEWSASGTVLGTNSAVTVSLPMGTNIVTLTVTDPCGASSKTNVSVIVADTTPPVGSCPAPVTVSADANCQARLPDFTSQVIATDNCTPTGALIIAQNPAPGTMLGLGQHPVTITVSDTSGNSSTCSVLFTVADTTAPVILSLPSSFTLSAGSSCQSSVPNILASVVASDSCTPADLLVKTQSPAPGTMVGIGAHTIQVVVSDASGNSANGSVSFTVSDTTPPVFLSGPTPLQLSSDAHCQAAVPNLLGAVLVTDNCTPQSQIVLTQNPLPGTLLPDGNYLVTLTATDASGNSSVFTVSLAITDTTAPTIQALSVSPGLLTPPNHQLVPVTVSALVTDNCDAAPVTKIVSITCNEAVASGDIQITGNLTAMLAASKSASGGTRIYTLNIQSIDASGNMSTGAVTVSVPKSSGNGSGNNKPAI